MPNKKITKKKVSKKKSSTIKRKRTKDLRTFEVFDNIPEGSHLQVPSGIFMAFFGKDLVEYYTQKNKDKK